MLNNGLSLDQSPPFVSSLRFFLTGPFFIMLIGVLIFGIKTSFLDRWETSSIAILHFFNLGFIVMVIMGALIQLLPVLAGTPIPHVVYFSTLTHLLLTIGAIFFPMGLLLMNQAMIQLGFFSAFLSITIFFAVIIFVLRKARPGFSVTCFRQSSIAALVMVSIATRLGLSWAGLMDFSIYRVELIELHIAWALFGCIYILILGVTYKVVPMFYTTVPFPQWFTRSIANVTFVLLLVWSCILLFISHQYFIYLKQIIPVLKISLSVSVMIFSLHTYWVFSSRRRKIPDTTINFWKISMVFFSIGSCLYATSQYFIFDPLDVISTLFFGCAIFSLIMAMLYKIIPFLAWFHLSAKNITAPPTMRELLPDTYLRQHFYAHVLTIVLLFSSLMFSILRIPFLLCLMLSIFLALKNLLRPVLMYRKLI